MDYLYFKALHIIFVVTWFSGLFYIVRLFIYFAEAEKKEAPIKDTLQHQYKLMSKRLWYIITWPSSILASVFGFSMLYTNPSLIHRDWMMVKLSFIVVLYLYQLGCHRIYLQQQKGIVKFSSLKLRIWNEVATILLFAVVFIVILKSHIHWLWGVAGIVTFSVSIMVFIRIYKKIQAKKSWDQDENFFETTEHREDD